MRRKRTVAPAAGVPVQPEPANDAQEVVYTVTELAQRWKVSRRTVTEAINVGRLKAFRVGESHFRIKAAEVLRYENEQQGKAAS